MKENILRIKNGFTGVFSGIYFIHRHILWKYVSFPIMITSIGGFLLKNALAGVLTYFLVTSLSGHLYDWFPVLHKIPFHISPAVSFLSSFFVYWPIYWLLSLVMTFIYNVVGSLAWGLFSGPLLEKTELILNGEYVRIPFSNSLKWALADLWDLVKDLILFGGLYAVSFLFLFLPFGGMILQGLLMILANSFIIGRSNMRAVLNAKVKTRKERNLLIRKKLVPESIGIGMPETLSVFLPVVNVFVFFFLWAGSLVGSAKIVKVQKLLK